MPTSTGTSACATARAYQPNAGNGVGKKRPIIRTASNSTALPRAAPHAAPRAAVRRQARGAGTAVTPPPAAATPASAVLSRPSPPRARPARQNGANPLKKALFFARAGCTIRSSAECDSYNTHSLLSCMIPCTAKLLYSLESQNINIYTPFGDPLETENKS